MIFEIQQDALRLLRGNWLKAVSLVFVCYMIAVVTGTSRSGISIRDGFSFSLWTFSTSDSLILIILGGFIASICFFAVVDLIYHIRIDNSKNIFTTFLYSFKNKSLLYKGFIIMALIRSLQFFGIFMFIISVLHVLFVFTGNYNTSAILRLLMICFIPFLILWLQLGLSQCMYILYDQPKIKLYKCIYYSFKLMNGSRWALIGLYIVFIFWFFLGLLALVVGALWSLAFFEATRFVFYQTLKSKHSGLKSRIENNGLT